MKSYLDSCGRKEKKFVNNLPGDDWFHSFMNRHKADLSIRTPDYIKLPRAKVNRQNVVQFFQNLEKTIENVPPENIKNFDESAVGHVFGQCKWSCFASVHCV